MFNMSKIEGTDTSIEESLFCYGFAWILSDCGKEYQFWYSIRNDDEGTYDRFDWGIYAADTDVHSEWDWADFDDVYQFTGMNAKEWNDQTLPNKVFDLLTYYGHMNIFGSTYFTSGWIYNSNLNRFQEGNENNG